MIWTADNELPALELAGNYPGIVKCYKIFDSRPKDGEEGVVHFVLELIEGGFLEGWLQENHKKGNYLSLAQWFKWAETMLNTVLFLHEKCFMIHSDLHQKNWLLNKENEIISCDFGCAKIIGEGGCVPAGSKVFCADIHSGPEAKMEAGKSFFEAVTQHDIDFKNDTFQLGFVFKCMLAQGEWMIGRPCPNTYGKEMVEFINWMCTEDKSERPTVRQCIERLATLKAEWLERSESAW